MTPRAKSSRLCGAPSLSPLVAHPPRRARSRLQRLRRGGGSGGANFLHVITPTEESRGGDRGEHDEHHLRRRWSLFLHVRGRGLGGHRGRLRHDQREDLDLWRARPGDRGRDLYAHGGERPSRGEGEPLPRFCGSRRRAHLGDAHAERPRRRLGQPRPASPTFEGAFSVEGEEPEPIKGEIQFTRSK